MPELPDVTLYLEALERKVGGDRLRELRVAGPSLLRTVDPPAAELAGRRAISFRRIGKRIALGFEGDLFAVLHLMIAGRLHWHARAGKLGARNALASFDFERGSVRLTEAGTKRRATLHLVRGEAALAALDPGGLEVLDCTLEAFRERLARGNHTLKRALTDPQLFSGIGNAYSDEILHAARLSPVALTQRLAPADVERLFEATRTTLRAWTERLRREVGDGFPEKVTAFRPEMAVHGRFREPCPACGSPVQRIVHAENECNYCATCQTGGRLLADRALSRLLKRDWPRSLEELEQRMRNQAAVPEP
jgi:formamidopyrimidine-DNA glycosylase